MSMLVNAFELGPPPVGGATFIGVKIDPIVSGTGLATTTLPPGTAAGDLMIAYTCNGNTPSPTCAVSGGASLLVNSAWTSFGFHSAIFSRVLTSGDISTHTVTFGGLGAANNGGVMVVIYRGATVVTVQSFQEATGGSLSFPGFTPSGSSKGVVTIITDDTIGNPETPVPPLGWTSRLLGSVQNLLAFSAGDQLAGYTNATTTWTSFDTTFDQAGHIVELT